MPSKLNYFVYKEQRNISQNHSKRYLEIVKKDLSVLKTVEWFVFAREALKPVWYFSASNDEFDGVSLFAFFFEIKGYFTEKTIQWFQLYPSLSNIKVWEKLNFPPLPRDVWFLRTGALNSLNTVACVYYIKLAWFRRLFRWMCVAEYRNQTMLFKKPHGCNNLQLNMKRLIQLWLQLCWNQESKCTVRKTLFIAIKINKVTGRLDYQPLFGKWAHAHPRKDGWTRLISIVGFSQSGCRLQIFVWQHQRINYHITVEVKDWKPQSSPTGIIEKVSWHAICIFYSTAGDWIGKVSNFPSKAVPYNCMYNLYSNPLRHVSRLSKHWLLSQLYLSLPLRLVLF